MAEIDNDQDRHDQDLLDRDRRCRGRPQVRPDGETRRLIYEAARHAFAGGGYATTSMETVARHAGVSTKTLYRLIPNKEALFEGMVSDRSDRFLSEVNLRAVDHVDIGFQRLTPGLRFLLKRVQNIDSVGETDCVNIAECIALMIPDDFHDPAPANPFTGLASACLPPCCAT